jgi:hypothetical protein
MKITTSEPVLECTFKEFWDGYWAKTRSVLGTGETQEDAETTLMGQSTIKPKFRIPAADNQLDIFFYNRELLCRFANLPTPTQANFLRSVRNVMDEKNVYRIIITIPWSRNTQRRLLIRGTKLGSTLDFELLR